MTYPIFTVGHSNHSPEYFIELLRKHDVTTVADVRSTPFSQYTPQFNKETLNAILKRARMNYVFLGRELGARPDNPSLYVNRQIEKKRGQDKEGGQFQEYRQVDYSRIVDTDLFKEGIERLLRGAKNQQIAVMCAEKDPLTCHRSNLISRALIDNGIELQHVLEDGQLESNDELLERLLEEYKSPTTEQLGLVFEDGSSDTPTEDKSSDTPADNKLGFKSEDLKHIDAFHRQELNIAYKDII